MIKNYLIRNSRLINEGIIKTSDVLIREGRIVKIADKISPETGDLIIEAEGKYLLPGIIDDQVHFREPGLTHKADIYSESRAAVAGGVTSFLEMPNTVPNTLSVELLEQKYELASKKSLANYSFYMGASNDNLEEILKVDPTKVCGVKIFMGSSTGNMLVDKKEALEAIFSNCKMLIAAHCEDESIIKSNEAAYKEQYGENTTVEAHPMIRSAEACYKSSSFAVELARKHNARLHVLHISTEKELELFDKKPLKDKRITAEACIHHLWFTDEDYKTKGNFIKWNPAIKTKTDREAILKAVNEDIIDVIATDHAPHTIEEKQKKYFQAPSGGPLIQHSLCAMFELYQQGKISLEKIVQKMCHAPAELFRIEKRGFIREGYWADLVLLNPKSSWEVNKTNIFYKCGWSPFEGEIFNSRVSHTFVNGHLVYADGAFDEAIKGSRLLFYRD